MARIPRDVNAPDLIKKLARYGYEPSRQSGSYIRVTRTTDESQNHITLPNHKPSRLGTLSSILDDVASYLRKNKVELVDELFS